MDTQNKGQKSKSVQFSQVEDKKPQQDSEQYKTEIIWTLQKIEPKEEQKKICYQWQKYNKCSYEDQCRFLHDDVKKSYSKEYSGGFRRKTDTSNNYRKNEKKEQQICKYFLKNSCTFGANCLNIHPEKSNSQIEVQDFNVTINDKFTFNEDEIKKLGLDMVAPPKYKIDKRDPVILIRHALSWYNYIGQRFLYETGVSFKSEKAKKYQLDGTLVDSGLHPYGSMQCENNQQYVNEIEFDTVFVSPLKRTLISTKIMFEKHPNRKNIKFVVLPVLSEIMSKLCDICNNTYSEVRKEYTDLEGWNFDFSELEKLEDPDLWQWDIIVDEQLKKDLKIEIEKIKSGKNEEENKPEEENKEQQEFQKNTSHLGLWAKLMLKEIDYSFPKAVEEYVGVYHRAQKTKNIIKEYIKKNKIDTTQTKIGVVSHHAFLSNFTSPGIDYDGYVKKGTTFNNCEIIPYDLD